MQNVLDLLITWNSVSVWNSENKVFKYYALEVVCLVNYLWMWSTVLLWLTYLALFYYSVPFKWILKYRAFSVLIVSLMVVSALSLSTVCCVISWNTARVKKGFVPEETRGQIKWYFCTHFVHLVWGMGWKTSFFLYQDGLLYLICRSTSLKISRLHKTSNIETW